MRKRSVRVILYILLGIIFQMNSNTVQATTISKIQPEGISKINIDFEFKQTMKDVSLELDLNPLMNEQIGGQKIIDYRISDGHQNLVSIQVLEEGKVANKVVEPSNYMIEIINNSICIKWNDSACATPFIGEEGSRYQVWVYISTKLNKDIQYGTLPNESKSYVGKALGNTKIIQAKLKGKVRMSEAYMKEGIYYPEEYDNIETEELIDLRVQYIKMASVY